MPYFRLHRPGRHPAFSPREGRRSLVPSPATPSGPQKHQTSVSLGPIKSNIPFPVFSPPVPPTRPCLSSLLAFGLSYPFSRANHFLSTPHSSSTSPLCTCSATLCPAVKTSLKGF
ncbi:rCG55947 [Rattus norvegicus]|uniref:RCG55947 n=1 Tax=Rattus norvegicus TaxID=10116 RepID=A6JMA0_RAT|nr:rCG55947 [Rattus norvegicus]